MLHVTMSQAWSFHWKSYSSRISTHASSKVYALSGWPGDQSAQPISHWSSHSNRLSELRMAPIHQCLHEFRWSECLLMRATISALAPGLVTVASC